jgi:L-ascorbate metabolism protein UlaG (beta-lactamase superfamily)
VTGGEPDVPWRHGAALRDEIASTTPPSGCLALWHIGQSGFVVKAGRTTLLIDPFLSPSTDRLRRTWEPPLTPDDLAGADYVLCSHDHLDHLDPFTVQGVAAAAPGARFVVPVGLRPRLEELGIGPERVIGAEVGTSHEEGPLVLEAIPAAHGDRVEPVAEYAWEPDPQVGHRFVGFLVTTGGVRLYHAGDTTIYPGMEARLESVNVDLALLPINGRDWYRERQGIVGNMNEKEAADLGHAVGADVIVPMHYDMFAGNPGNPGWFAEYCASAYPEQEIHVPARCKRWLYLKSPASSQV